MISKNLRKRRFFETVRSSGSTQTGVDPPSKIEAGVSFPTSGTKQGLFFVVLVVLICFRSLISNRCQSQFYK